MPQALLAIFIQIASVIGGALNGALGTAVSMMQAGTKAALQFHQEGISLARDLGMGLNQANAYTKVLTERTEVLAKRYGVATSAITAVQRNISETTGKQLLLNDAQAEGFVQANKLVGQETTNKFMDTIINGMGGQVSAVQGAISKAYATAAKQGLNAQKFSKKIAENLSMANRLNFRNGIDGITRMAAMAEKFGLSMKSVETAAGQFMEFDSAIEHSAHLQMLGGSIGAAFGNPLENMYESMYDPEAFAKRMEDAMKGMATFDAKKGYATISPMNQEILRNYAKEMGLNAEEVVANAKKMAEVRYKETKFAPELDRYSGNGKDKEARRNFILNNSQVTPEGQLQVNGKNINEITEEEWSNMMAFDGKSDTDILKNQALHLKSIDEAITGNASSIAASFAKGLALDKNAQNIIQNIDKVGTNLQKVSENLGIATNGVLTKILNWINKNGPFLKSIADGVIGVSKFLADNWGKLLIAIVGWKFLLKPALGANLGGNTTLGGKLGAKALGGIRKGLKARAKGAKRLGGKALQYAKAVGKKGYDILGKGGANHSWKQAKNYARNAFRMTKGNVLRKTLHGAKSLWKNSKALRASVKGGAAILGVAGNMATDYLVNKGKIKKGGAVHYGAKMASTAAEYGALGATIGSVIPGLGTAVGGGIGAAVGAIKGAYDTWKSLPENADKDFIDYAKSVGDSIVEGGKEAFNWAKEKVGPALSAVDKDIKERGGYLSVAFNAITTPIRLFINAIEGIGKLILHPVDTIKNSWNSLKNWWNSDNKLERLWNMGKNAVMGEKHADGGIVGGNSYSGDRILTSLNSGEMVLNKDQQTQLFKFIQNASSILTKIGSSNGVTYYNASNKHSAIHNNVGGNILSNILSTIFNSNSNIVSSALNTNNNIKTVPFGENSFRKIPKSEYTEYSYNKGGEIVVKDINLNVNGTLKLDAGTVTKNLDINQLLSDTTFISSLKDLIKQSINNDINNGRFMNDIASMRGMPSQVGLWGRK